MWHVPVWPDDPEAANRLYHELVLSLVESYEIPFGDDLPNPTQLLRGFLEGNVSADELNRNAADWWSVLDDPPEQLLDFSSAKALTARFALVLLHPQIERDELDDHFNWVVELFTLRSHAHSGVMRRVQEYCERTGAPCAHCTAPQ